MDALFLTLYENRTPMVFLSHTSEVTKWLMHVLSPCDPLTPLQYICGFSKNRLQRVFSIVAVIDIGRPTVEVGALINLKRRKISARVARRERVETCG